MQEPGFVMTRLKEAKEGVASAQDFICRYVWERYGYKINRFYSVDSAEDREDHKQIFWMAVHEHIPKLTHHGNPVWHLAVRGTWKVGDHIRRREKKARMAMISLDAGAALDDASWTQVGDPRIDVESFVVQQIGSLQQVELIARLDYWPTARRALEAILSGEAGDPTEIGFNKNLAEVMDVSPQRASQAMAALRSTVETAGVQQ